MHVLLSRRTCVLEFICKIWCSAGIAYAAGLAEIHKSPAAAHAIMANSNLHAALYAGQLSNQLMTSPTLMTTAACLPSCTIMCSPRQSKRCSMASRARTSVAAICTNCNASPGVSSSSVASLQSLLQSLPLLPLMSQGAVQHHLVKIAS